MIKVKICGIRNPDDALFAAYQGADAIGAVNVESSKRYVDLSTIRRIFMKTPPLVSKVVVASPKSIDEAKKIAETGADYLQLHGDVEFEYMNRIREETGLRLIKQHAVEDLSSVETAREYAGYADLLVLDTKSAGVFGGTGKTHDWNISAEIVKSVSTPALLAGGLNPENVEAAIEAVRPYGVDVASGVETGPGVKDREKIIEFIRRAKKP